MKAYEAERAGRVKLEYGQVLCDPYAISECLCPEYLILCTLVQRFGVRSCLSLYALG